MYAIKQISRLQLLVLAFALMNASQSFYNNLVAPNLRRPQIDLTQTNNLFSTVATSVAKDKAAIVNFIDYVKSTTNKPVVIK